MLDRSCPESRRRSARAGSRTRRWLRSAAALAGVANGTLIVNLPGSTGGVKDGLAVLDDLLEHLVAQLAGEGAHD